MNISIADTKFDRSVDGSDVTFASGALNVHNLLIAAFISTARSGWFVSGSTGTSTPVATRCWNAPYSDATIRSVHSLFTAFCNGTAGSRSECAVPFRSGFDSNGITGTTPSSFGTSGSSSSRSTHSTPLPTNDCSLIGFADSYFNTTSGRYSVAYTNPSSPSHRFNAASRLRRSAGSRQTTTCAALSTVIRGGSVVGSTSRNAWPVLPDSVCAITDSTSSELSCQISQAAVFGLPPTWKPTILSRSTDESTTIWHQLSANAANSVPNASRNFVVANCSGCCPS